MWVGQRRRHTLQEKVLQAQQSILGHEHPDTFTENQNTSLLKLSVSEDVESVNKLDSEHAVRFPANRANLLYVSSRKPGRNTSREF